MTCSIAGCVRSGGSDPAIEFPERTRLDQRTPMTVTGLTPESEATIRTSTTIDETTWDATATFETDEAGQISLESQAPIDGDYDGVDPMGLFWAMDPAQQTSDNRLDLTDPFDVEISVSVDGATTTDTTTERWPYDPAVSSRIVDNAVVRGAYVTPPGEDPAPGVVLLHGAGRGIPETVPKLLASHGYAVLAPRYFGGDRLPDRGETVPVETVGQAIDWLLDQPETTGEQVALLGGSKGGELALVAGAVFDRIGAVISGAGSGIAWEARDEYARPQGRSSWSVDGEPVEYVELGMPGTNQFDNAFRNADSDEIEAATIPVEQIDAPVLLYAGEFDQVWPSGDLHQIAADRLEAHGRSDYDHIVYDDADHFISLFPYAPAAATAPPGISVATTTGHVRASEDALERTLAAFEQSHSVIR